MNDITEEGGVSTGVTDEMIRLGEDAIEDLLQMLGVLPGERPQDGYRDEPYARTIARAAVAAALAGRVVVDLPSPERKWIEFCRACRDERDEIVPADFILWGKLLPSGQLGPRCYNHATAHIGVLAMAQIDQWAVFDLRPFNRALAQSSGVAGGGVPHE